MQSQPDPKDARKSDATVPPIPEMVGATSAPFFVGAGTTQVSFPMHLPTGPALLRADSTKRNVTLRIENVTCNKRSPTFKVYLNVPVGDAPEKHPELRAGLLGMFGLVRASDPAGEDGGRGMTFDLDVTDLFARLQAMKNWDPQNLRMSFVPTAWDAPVPQVKVGRVSLYFL
jgi:tyrosinase